MMHPYYMQQIARQEREQREAEARLYRQLKGRGKPVRRTSPAAWLRQQSTRLLCKLQVLQADGCAA